MGVSLKWYGQAMLRALSKEVDYLGDPVKLMLCTPAYALDQDAHVYKSHVTNEVVGTGYTAGGALLTNKSRTYAAGTNVTALRANNVIWTPPTAIPPVRYAVAYIATGSDATSVLLGYIDFDADVSATNVPFEVEWDAAGILTVTVH